MSIEIRWPRVLSMRAACATALLVVAASASADHHETTQGPGIPEAPHATTTHTDVSQPSDYDEILTTAAPHSRRRFDVIQGTTVLSHEELERSLQTSLGETLSELPGISSTYFGPGASRPVIRGLDGPRIRILQNGIGTLDASVTSPDHAVAADPLATSRVEVIRGAGTLVYGSSAIGGVVNVDDGRIPQRHLDETFEGDVRALYGSAADEKSAAAGISADVGPVVFRGSGFFRDTNDLQIPGFAISDRLAAARPDLDRGPEGVAQNTDVDNKGGTLGASWIGELGMLGASFGVTDGNYGVPAEPDEAIRIDLNQKRADAVAKLDRQLWIFETSSFRFGYGDYRHVELEGGQQATQFDNQGYEGRFDLVQKPWKDLHGSVGLQFHVRDFEAIGDEVFTPPSDTVTWGLFGVEEYHRGDLTLEGGIRFEQQTTKSASADFARVFNTVSFSAGLGWVFFEDYLLGLSVSRTERAPSVEELLSFGPHLATGSYEIGAPALDREAGVTVELAARKKAGRWSGALNLYYTHFDDFIFPEALGFVDEDGSPDPTGDLVLRQYVQRDADFLGAELQGAVEAIQHDEFTGSLDLAFDCVYATESESSTPLPRIPPIRVKGGIEGRSEYADLRLELWWVAEQSRTAAFELPTDDYFMVNLILTVHPFPDERDVTLLVQGKNLTDAEGRVHSSFLKDRLPLAGREARVGLRVAF